MKTQKIKRLIRNIIQDNTGIIYNDTGNGAGGPGFADPDTLQEMLAAGNFDDAIEVACDINALRDSICDGVAVDIDGTDWRQIEFNYSDCTDYNMIAWIWEV